MTITLFVMAGALLGALAAIFTHMLCESWEARERAVLVFAISFFAYATTAAITFLWPV